ncbi:M28 family peptidase [candidate division KSB1 bacterium]
MVTITAFFLFSGYEIDRCVVPASIRDAVLNEFSGELALRHVEILSVDRNRQADEYLDRFFETEYFVDMFNQYGLSEVKVDFFPSGEIWDAEEGDLWLVSPESKKIAGLTIIPESLAAGSASADVETEVVHVGLGRPEDYEGKNVAGKIVFGNTSVSSLYNSGVVERNAVGALGTGYSGTNSNVPGYSQDAVGWQSVRGGGNGFGFVLSKRQYEELRGYFDRGQRVVVKAHVKTTMYPYKMNVTSAMIPGTDPEAGEFIVVAHAFERIGTPGANDNCSGVGTLLEVARTLQTLIDRGELPRPKRSIRFLLVPEISGSRAFMYQYPDLQDKLLAAMNFDMTGANLETTDTYLRMKMTPDSRPSYLNDLMTSLFRFVDQTEIRTPWGNNAPFNFRFVPFIASSDHVVFLNAGIPAMQFNHWPDNFYHSSEDRSIYVDPTEMKRVGFMTAAGFYYLATAEQQEAQDLAWEAAANGEKRMAEVARQSVRLLGSDPQSIHEQHKAAQTKINGAFQRAKGSVESVFDLSRERDVQDIVNMLVSNLEESRKIQSDKMENIYKQQCSQLNVNDRSISLTDEEKRYERMIPSFLYKFYSEEYRSRSGQVNRNIPAGSPRFNRLAQSEIPYFINGERSILDIYNLVRAEYGNVITNNSHYKFAYVVTTESSDIPLIGVVNYIMAMEQAGLIEISNR